MRENRINSFTFLRLSRALSRPTQRLVREVRPGLPGSTNWRTGRRCEPFTLRSVADCPSIDAAELLLRSYESIVGDDPVLAVWADIDLDCYLIIHDVQPEEEGLYATLLGIGGLTGGASAGMCRCVWTVESLNPFGF